MSNAFNVVVKREFSVGGGEKRTQWLTIGKAFANKKGGGFTILLNALPIPGPDGQVSMSMFPDTGRPEKPQQNLPLPEPEAGDPLQRLQDLGKAPAPGPVGDDPPPSTSSSPPADDDCPF